MAAPGLWGQASRQRQELAQIATLGDRIGSRPACCNYLSPSVDLRALERGYTRTQTSVGESMRVPRIEHDQWYPVESKS
jgi:hypothetical protein